ncbi:NAD(P)H-binding protein [Amycolatopsis circi]|uniref:NAD(P)H-binding protein n=1 Tax=Amycolatopsis circi TaxID=871959 RepID=UPI000E22506B|nr:NAD(P)H-binding protein [Amycolatopsis circi]
MILVTGATGTVGGAVLARLSSDGVAATALTRRPAAARLPPGTRVVAGDLGAPESLPRALAGIDSVFLMSPGHCKAFHDANLVDAAAEAGVRRIVQLSSAGVAEAADSGEDNALARWHRDAEDALRSSGLEWTILRPGEFMSNALAWAESIRADGTAATPAPDLVQAPVDPADIAAVAVEALREPGHAGKTYALSGPEQLSAADQIAVLGAVLGRGVEVRPISLAQHRSAMARRHPEETVAGVLEALEQALARPGNVRAECVPTVPGLLGRPAATFRQWAVRHASAFA